MRGIVNWLFNGWALQWWQNAIAAFIFSAIVFQRHVYFQLPLEPIDFFYGFMVYLQLEMMAKKPASRQQIEKHNLC
jgi:hypothetical protein